MSDLELLLKGYQDREVIEYVASEAYKDENGEPMKWHLKAIESDLDEAIRRDCTKRIKGARGGTASTTIDTDKYVLMVCVNTVVKPNLNDAETQDAFNVKSADALLKKLLRPGELLNLKEKVMEVNGFDVSMDDLVEEAKN